MIAGVSAPSATRPAQVRIAVPNTNYELHLVPSGEVRAGAGALVHGTIHAQARRIDRVGGGGRFIEPVVGRPRRVQGSVVVVEGDAVVVNAGVPIHCVPTDPRQRASGFEPGEFVGFDVMEGAEFREREAS